MTAEILIVEDDSATQTVIQKIMEKVGCTTTVVTSAEEALEIMQTKQFFLILSDISLPGLSGTELAKFLRTREAGTNHHTYLVAVTGHIDEYSRKTCIEAGMDGYLTKPIDRLKLKAFVERVLKAQHAPEPVNTEVVP